MTTWSEPDPLPEAAPAEIAVYDNLDRHRFEILSSGQLAGYSEYRDLPYGRAFVHTVVDSRCEGIGLGSELIKTALDEARDRQRNVIPLCPFVRRYLRDHPADLDLVADRKRFGLDLPPDDPRLR